jgi:tetratricopeptide (TPR) repeat protein
MSSSTPIGRIAAGGTVPTIGQPADCRIPLVVKLLMGLFGVLLSSFPARNLDLWSHLANGRDLLALGSFSPTWIYDLATFAVYSVFGGVGLAAAKSLMMGFVAIVLLHLGTKSSWRIALAVTGLAVLAMSNRLLLQPQTASVVGLVIVLWLIHHRRVVRADRVWPAWSLVALFLVWANVDHWFILGLAVTALILLGQILDDRSRNPVRQALISWAVTIGILAAVTCISVTNLEGFRIPIELRTALSTAITVDEGPAIHSPFHPTYRTVFRDNSSALAYFPLFAFSVLSFLLNRKAWSWSWLLPYVLLAVISALEARTIPFFAVLAGPVTARNVQEFFARRPTNPPRRKWTLVIEGIAGGVVATAFLLGAWTGLLQGPPYEPRRLAVEMPPAFSEGADFLRQTHSAGVWPPETRSLHVSPDTLGVFAWIIPDDDRIQNDTIVSHLLAPDRQDDARTALRESKVNRVVVWAGDQSTASRAMLDRLLADPVEWRLLTLSGGLVVFGWADPASPASSQAYQGRELDVNQLAFQPTETQTAPATGLPKPPRWWDAFWKRAYPTRPAGRDEATVLLRHAESHRVTAPYQNLMVWESGQVVGLVGAAGTWSGPAGLGDLALRLTLFRPPLPNGTGADVMPQTEMVFALQKRYAADRGAIPIGDVLAAVRAARRAMAENPTDANAHYTLAKAYTALANHTAEYRWSGRDGIPQIRRVRQVQASAALNNAVNLNPRLAPAHRDLANLYRTIGCFDLAVEHLQAYQALDPQWGGLPKTGPAAEDLTAEVNQWVKQLQERLETYERDSANLSVSERALLAVRMELGGLARSILLKSDVSAFGAQGVEMELDLLLRTGRPQEVLDITTPVVGGSLGAQKYHWTLAQAHLAVGNYEAADQDLIDMVGQGGSVLLGEAIAEQVAGVVGKSIIDAQPSVVELNNILWLAFSRADLQAQLTEVARTLGQRANMVTLRAVMAMESGNTALARQLFRHALTHSPRRWGSGQLEFNGRRIAWDALELLESVSQSNPSRR